MGSSSDNACTDGLALARKDDHYTTSSTTSNPNTSNPTPSADSSSTNSPSGAGTPASTNMRWGLGGWGLVRNTRRRFESAFKHDAGCNSARYESP
jgi:hypothetical protein